MTVLHSLSRVYASEFGRNVRRLMVGTGLAQAITVLSTLVVARLFEPVDFGVAALFLSVTTTLSAVASLKYDQAVVTQKSDSVAVELLALAILLAIVMSFALLVILSCLVWFAPELVWVKQLGAWIYVIPIGVLLMASYYAFSAWLMRKKQYARLASCSVALSAATAGSRIGFGLWWGSSVAGLVLGSLLGMVAQLWIVIIGIRAALPAVPKPLQWLRRRYQLAREYKDFPCYTTPAALIRQVGEDLPVYLLSLMFTPAIVGFYAVAYRLIRLPVGIIGESLRKVYLQRSAQRLHDGSPLRPDLLKVTLGMLGMGALPTIVIVISGPWLFATMLGARWATAGEYAVIMVPWLLAAFLAAPASTVYIVLRRQSMWLRMQLGRTLLMGGAFVLPYLFGREATDCLAAFTITGIFANVTVVVTALGLCSGHDRTVASGTKVPLNRTPL